MNKTFLKMNLKILLSLILHFYFVNIDLIFIAYYNYYIFFENYFYILSVQLKIKLKQKIKDGKQIKIRKNKIIKKEKKNLYI